MAPVPSRTAPLAADQRIGLLSRFSHRSLCRFRSGDHFIDADHEGVLDGFRLRMEKDCPGAFDNRDPVPGATGPQALPLALRLMDDAGAIEQ